MTDTPSRRPRGRTVKEIERPAGQSPFAATTTQRPAVAAGVRRPRGGRPAEKHLDTPPAHTETRLIFLLPSNRTGAPSAADHSRRSQSREPDNRQCNFPFMIMVRIRLWASPSLRSEARALRPPTLCYGATRANPHFPRSGGIPALTGNDRPKRIFHADQLRRTGGFGRQG